MASDVHVEVRKPFIHPVYVLLARGVWLSMLYERI